MNTAALTTGFALAFVSTSAHALRSRPVPNGGVESFTFQSPSMGVRFSLNVGLPQGFKAGDGKKYPALILTDGDFVFGNVYASAHRRSRVRSRRSSSSGMGHADVMGTSVARGLRTLYAKEGAA